MASRKLVKLYRPYLNCSSSAEICFSSSINLFFRVQVAQVSSLMMLAPSSPQISQKHWDELSQPPSPKGKDLLIQNNVTAIEICCMLVNSSPKTSKLFDVCPMMLLSNKTLKKTELVSWQVDLVTSWSHESWSGGNWSCENWSHDTDSSVPSMQ